MPHGRDVSFSFFFFFYFLFSFPFSSHSSFFPFFCSGHRERRIKGEKDKKKEKGKILNGPYFSAKIMPRHVRVACHINAT
jgi:hypothetical protein